MSTVKRVNIGKVDNVDWYRLLAAGKYGVSYEDVKGEMRKDIKFSCGPLAYAINTDVAKTQQIRMATGFDNCNIIENKDGTKVAVFTRGRR